MKECHLQSIEKQQDKKYNKLTLIKFSGVIKGKRYWECLCDCGETKIIREQSVIKGTTKTCGKCKIPIDLINQRFGQLTVLELAYRKKYNIYWKCLCDCGKETFVPTESLRGNLTKSCGCLKLNSGKKSKLWKGCGEISGRYWSIIQSKALPENRRRDRSKPEISFEITIEEAWDLFLKQNRKCALSGQILVFPESHTRGERTASLDRIDNLKGYSIENVQWVHKDINIMKNDHEQDYFIELCKKVAEFNDR